MKRSFCVYMAIVVLLMALSPILPIPKVSAASKQTVGFSVAPAQLSFTIEPGADIQTAKLVITNSYDISLRLVADLRAIDESAARLVPTGPIDEKLAKAVKLSATDIMVPPQKSYTLNVAIDGSALTDGGHYASLVLTQRPSTISASSFVSAVAVNLFIIKNENIRTDLRLTDFRTNRTFFSMPTSATASFQNSGNTHVIPRASVSIYDGETLVTKALVNTSSLPLFPEQQAKYAAPFETYNNILLPRKLYLRMMYRIDGSDIQLVREQTFWYVPILDLVVLIVLVAGIWWRRRQLRRLIAMIASKLRPTKLRQNGSKKLRKQVAAPRTTTKRMLGRTVIRTHQAANRPIARAAIKLPESTENTTLKQLPIQKYIVVTIAEEAALVPKPTTIAQSKVAKPSSTSTPKPKANPRQPKTVKKAPKSTATTSKAKLSKKTAATSPKKASPKTQKTTAQSKRKKTT